MTQLLRIALTALALVTSHGHYACKTERATYTVSTNVPGVTVTYYGQPFRFCLWVPARRRHKRL